MQPAIDATMRFMTSEAAPVETSIGASPMNMQATVMNFVRMRFTALCTMASRRSAWLRSHLCRSRSLTANRYTLPVPCFERHAIIKLEL
jgi:hypothetical protein